MFEKLTKIIMFFVIFFTLLIYNNIILFAQPTDEDDQFQKYDMYNDIRKDIPISEDESISEFPEDQCPNFSSNQKDYSFDPARWMQKIKDHAVIGDLSIPGSHDSATFHEAPNCPESVVRCQRDRDNFLIQMKDLGIRAFDLRLKENMQFFHGKCWLNLGLREFIKDAKQFLTNFNSEFLIAHVKDENAYCTKENQFYNYFMDIVTEEKAQEMFLYLGKDLLNTPIEKLRGKVVVITRKRDKGNCGWIQGATMIDFPDDDTVEHTNTDGCKNCIDAAISDDYEKPPLKKAGQLTKHLVRATRDNEHRLYIGFLSGCRYGGCGGTTPSSYASNMMPNFLRAIYRQDAEFIDCCSNSKYKAYICRRNFSMQPPLEDGKLGTVFMDFVSDYTQTKLISEIIGCNAN